MTGAPSESRRDPALDTASSPSDSTERLWALAWSERDGLRTLETIDDIAAAHADEGTRIWVDLQGAERELQLRLSHVFGLHPLVSEDLLESNQRAKVELTADVLHIVMFALRYEGETVSHEIDIVLGRSFLLTSHDGGVNPRRAPFMLRDRGAHLSGGTDYTLWALADWIVDGYFPVFDRLGEEIDELEDDVMRSPSGWIVERLFRVRRDLLTIRRTVMPQREIFNQLTNRDLALIDPQRIVYFRDVYDHLIRLTDELDSFRELVSTTLDIYLSQVNNRLSDIMKRLTGVTVILAGMGAVAGIFGMSEAGLAFNLRESAGFWIVSAAIVALAAAAAAFLRRINWI